MKKVKKMRLRLHGGILSIERVDDKSVSNVGDCTFLSLKKNDLVTIFMDLIKNHFDQDKEGVTIRVEAGVNLTDRRPEGKRG